MSSSNSSSLTPTPITTTNTTSNSSSPTPTPTSNTTTANTTSTPSSTGSSSGTSSGGISSAGAGAAIGISILVVFVIAFFCIKRRRRRNRRDLESRDAGHLSLPSQHSLSATPPANSIDENAPRRLMLPRALAGILGRIAFNSEDDFRGSSQFGPRNYSYKELRIATKNFSESELLGAGGFGSVYRGMLPEDRTYVAVKCIAEKSSQGAKEYKAEVSIISDLRHRNLVRLRGWCHDHSKFLLVYDYMPNGSLDRLLFNDSLCSKLRWERRYSIAAGLGSALQYLHEECEKVIIHRDIKSSNLLLDENFNAKLGDFGLSRQVEQGITSHTTTLAGTRGYMAPECFFGSGKATQETDVFAFGAVLLELVCGKRVIDWSLTEHEGMLVDWVWHLHSQGKVMEAVDRRLEGMYEEEEARRVLLVGLICSSPYPKERPKVRRAMEALMGSVALPAVPPNKPSLFSAPSLSHEGPQLVANLSSTVQGPAERDVKLQVSRIKDLKVELKESEQKMVKPGQFIADGSSPSPLLLQDARIVMQSALVACAGKVNEQVKLIMPGIRSSTSTFIQQLCTCFFYDFETASFGVTQKVDATFQRPDKDQKLRLFGEYQQYSGENVLTLFKTNQGLFRAFCLSKLRSLIYNHSDSTPFTSPDQRSSVLHHLLQSHSCPLFADFIELAKTVWLLHKLAFAFNPIAEIFSANAGESYNPQYMEVQHGITGDVKKCRGGEPITGDYVTVPGFIVQNRIIKAHLLHFQGKETREKHRLIPQMEATS